METNAVIDNLQLLKYIDAISSRESDHAKALRKKIAALGQVAMSVDPVSGQLLSFLVKLIGATRVLEIGTYYGYSALWLAEALPDQGQLTTCDIDAAALKVAKEAWMNAGVTHKIQAITQKAVNTLDDLLQAKVAPFDFVFIDADKRSYHHYYECSLQLLRPGGLIVIDNVLSFGKSLVYDNPSAAGRAVDQLNRQLQQDGRVDLVTLSVGDGLTLLRKRG